MWTNVQPHFQPQMENWKFFIFHFWIITKRKKKSKYQTNSQPIHHLRSRTDFLKYHTWRSKHFFFTLISVLRKKKNIDVKSTHSSLRSESKVIRSFVDRICCDNNLLACLNTTRRQSLVQCSFLVVTLPLSYRSLILYSLKHVRVASRQLYTGSNVVSYWNKGITNENSWQDGVLFVRFKRNPDRLNIFWCSAVNAIHSHHRTDNRNCRNLYKTPVIRKSYRSKTERTKK